MAKIFATQIKINVSERCNGTQQNGQKNRVKEVSAAIKISRLMGLTVSKVLRYVFRKTSSPSGGSAAFCFQASARSETISI